MAITVEIDTNWTPGKLVLRTDDGSGLSPDQVSFWENVRSIESNVREHFDVKLANSFVKRICDLSKSAFKHSEPTKIDFEALESIQNEAVKEGVVIRNRRLVTKLKNLLFFSVLGGLLVLIWLFGIQYMPIVEGWLPIFSSRAIDVVNWIGVIGFGTVGVGLGAILKAVFSSRVVNFTTLSELENYKFPPLIYLVLLWGVLLGALFCLSLGFFDIFVGDTSLAGSIGNPPSGFVLGVLCGFSETTIANRISNSFNSAAAGSS